MGVEQSVDTRTTVPKWKLLIASLATLFIVLALVCVGLELGIRSIAPQDLSFFDDAGLRKNAWEYVPHATQSSFVGVPVRINNVGLRGPTVVIPKRAGAFRVVAVGDSVAFGYGIPYERTFASVLERQLNNEAPIGIHYEVLNAGMPATNLNYYDYFVRNRAAQLQPDLIMICLAMNDITDYEGAPATPALTRPRRFDYYPMRYSHLYSFLYVKVKSVLYGLGVLDLAKLHDSDFLPILPPSESLDRAWRSTISKLDAMLSEIRRLQAEPVIVLFPMEPQMSPQTLGLYRTRFHINLGNDPLDGGPQRILRNYAAGHGLTFVDLLPVFRAASGSKPLFLRNVSISYDPLHPSEAGHQVAGDALFRSLRARFLR